ncbi:MAG: hypothetical protein ACO3UU_15540 [Minisyncoccia bacterium]
MTSLITEEGSVPFGFIYEITCKLNGRKYIGKKQCKKFIKRQPLKGKKNRRIEEVESDWREYTSSSRELNEDIAKLGKENFEFKIIKWCDSKFDLAYSEAKIQFDREVLLKDEYYNGIINLRVGRPKKRNI